MVTSIRIRARRAGSLVQDANGNDLGHDTKYPVMWQRRREYSAQRLGRFTVPAATFNVANTQGQWNGLQIDDEIEIQSRVGSGSWVDEWNGRIDRIKERRYQTRRQLVIRCTGYLADLDRDVSLGAASLTTPSGVMTALWDAISLPSARRGTVDTTTLIRDFPAQTINGLDCARRLETTARGFLRETRSGQITLDNYDARAAITTGAALSGFTHYDLQDDWERSIPDGGIEVPPGYFDRYSRAAYITWANVLATTNRRVTVATWYGRYDEARAQTLEIGQVLPVNGVNHSIEGLRHRWLRGKRRQVTLWLVPYQPYPQRFLLNSSLLDGTHVWV